MLSQSIWTIIYIFIYASGCNCFEPISTVSLIGGIILSATYAGWKSSECVRRECCDLPWVDFNITVLEKNFEKLLYGQHLVEFVVSRSLKGNARNKNPKKALVMAFHGWTGSGKNHVSKIIADSLYKKGSSSEFVHWYVSTQHFPHKQDVQKYRERLQKEIPEFTKRCGRSLFIFDEMDKMPRGVIDVLKPYMDYYDEIDGVDYRRNIFIFLSNAGGSDITRVAFNFWSEGRERKEIAMKDIEPIINRGAFNEKGGLQKSEIVSKNLIDVYIPFLPLEKVHVKQCIINELEARGQVATDDIVDKVASQLIYQPPDFELFSASGCKKVAQKVDVYAEDD